MPRPMLPEELQLLIAGYVLGSLEPEEAAVFEQLLATDPAVAVEVNQIQNTLEMAYSPPEVFPSAQLRSTILAASSSKQNLAEPLQALSESRSRRTQSWFTWGRTVNIAAAVLIFALGISNLRLWQTLQVVQSEARQYKTLTYTLQGTKTASTASAAVAVDPNTLEARLSAQNLPPLSPGKTYVLWTVLKQDAPFTTDSKKAILTEVFLVDAQGNVSQTITVPKVYRSQNLVAKVAITVEDVTSPQKHIGTPLLITNY